MCLSSGEFAKKALVPFGKSDTYLVEILCMLFFNNRFTGHMIVTDEHLDVALSKADICFENDAL